MEIADRIGKAAFNFNLVLSIIITTVGIALLAAGQNPGSQVTGMFLPISWLYGKTEQIQQSFPSNYTSIGIASSLISAKGIIAVTLEFLFMMLGGFLALVYTISTIIPQQLSFLVPALYFLGAYLQLMVWIYGASKIVSLITSLTGFSTSSTT